MSPLDLNGAGEPRAAQIDFDRVNRAALSRLPDLLSRWLPGGTTEGSEYVARNPRRFDQRPGSFKINVKTGAWSDFSPNAGSDAKGGDPVSLFAYLEGLCQTEAAWRVNEATGGAGAISDQRATARKDPVWTPMIGFPEHERRPDGEAWPHGKQFPTHSLGRPSAVFWFEDAAGQTIVGECRFDPPGKLKEYRPLTFCQSDGPLPTDWRWKGPAKPYPLFNLPRLASEPDKPVLLTEGARKAVAAATLFPDHVPTAMLFGAKSPQLADCSPCAGRVVRIWPDNDEPGSDFAKAAAQLVTAAGALSVGTVKIPGTFPAKWDLANDLPPGVDVADLRRLVAGVVPIPAGEIAKAADDRRKRDELAALIDEFNLKYAVVNENGKAFVYGRNRDVLMEREVLVRSGFADFKKFYQNRLITVKKADGSTQTKTAADWWLNSARRRQYLGGVVLDPTGTASSDCWNLWTGFAYKPLPGDWSLWREHIRDVICGGSPDHFGYVIGWLARLFQYPARRGEVAIVMRGKRGAGKGIFAGWVLRALGQHGMQISNPRHLVGNFNAHLRDCVALFADEAFFAGDRSHQGVLQALITERTIPIEAKRVDVIEVRNLLHVLMASNDDWVVPAGTDERRYAIFDVANHRIGQRAYFKAIEDQMSAGGCAAMLHDLLSLDISGFEVRDFPHTEALGEQVVMSLPSIDRWWLEVLQRGYVWRSRFAASEFKKWEHFCSTELLFRSYLQFCRDTGERYPKSRVDLGKMMTGLYAPRKPQGDWPIGEADAVSLTTGSVVINATRPTGYELGDIDQARVAFAQNRNIKMDWHDQDDD